MRIFGKLAWRNIKRKKLRFLLVFLTFWLSALTLMAAVFFREAAMDSRLASLRDQTLNSQLSIVSAKENDPYFAVAEPLAHLNQIPGIEQASVRIGAGAALVGQMDAEELSVIGIDYAEQMKVFPFSFVESQGLEPFAGKAIISEATAHRVHLELGGRMELRAGDRHAVLTIAGIAPDKGIFQYEGMVFIAREEASNLFDREGQATSIGLTLRDLEELGAVKAGVQKGLDPALKVQQNYDLDYYEAYVGTVSMALTIFSAFAVFLTLYLTYSTFKTLIQERMGELGTLRSVGASKKQIVGGLLLENAWIASLSAAIGIAAGIPMTRYLLQSVTGEEAAIAITGWKVLLLYMGLVGAGLASVLSSALAAVRLSLVESLKGGPRREKSAVRMGKTIIGAGLLILAVTSLFAYGTTKEGFVWLIAALVLFVVGFVLLLEVLHRMLLTGLSPLLALFGAEIRLAGKELKRSYVRSAESLVLISLVIGIAFLSFQTSALVRESSQGVYGTMDVALAGSIPGAGLAPKLQAIDGVDKVISQTRATRRVEGIKVELAGIDPADYGAVAFESFGSSPASHEFAKLQKDRSLIITTTFAKAAHKKVGDVLELPGAAGGLSYQIVSICSSFENMGKVLFLPRSNLERDFAGGDSSFYLLKAKDGVSPDAMENAVRGAIPEQEYSSLTTIDRMMEANDEQNAKLFLIVDLLFLLSAGVSVIGLNNNLMLSILTRKRSFAIERTIGMSQTQLLRTIVGESLLLCLEGGLLGLLLGWGMNEYLVRILAYRIGDLSGQGNPAFLPLLLICAVFLGAVSAILPYRSLRRMDVIPSIKGVE
ncbi:FtsX-like permease family protein [Gorillibacterium sp. CAU 1737]|uniref:FtsX-like permease family protein n=1 Tax=Gorillibacterium sp. CAU 1737 TaxID=3140362 RepID=UPI003261D11B